MDRAIRCAGVWRLGVCGTLVAGLLVAAAPTSASAADGPPESDKVTFTKDVAPIFQDKCQSCHRPGYIAPMSLVTYEDARPWARSIKTRVASRQMPPWHIDKTVGIRDFKNDRSLSDGQIDTIVRWVDSGAPKGDPNDMPPPRRFADDDVWGFAAEFGPPDLVLKSPAYTVPAVAQDAWYKPVVKTGLTEPRWVRAIEIRPASVAGRKVTHHALAMLRQDEPQGVSAGLFMEWAVGKQGEIMRPNSGKLMLPGSDIIFEVHYHAVGEEITDSVELGIYFYPKGEEPKHRQVLNLFGSLADDSIDIPPNSTYVRETFHVMRRAGRVENFQPHMHLRGKAMSMHAVLPDGRRQLLSYVDRFNFNWHVNYVYADDVAPLLPKGTVIHITFWYDNTAANPNNPDPNQWVGFGDRTVDEMGHAWVNVTYMSDEDYEAEVKARAARVRTTTAQQP